MSALKRDLLLHPIRLRMVQAMVGRPMTARDLLDVLGDVPQATLYRHVKVLVDGGLLAVVDEQPVRGGVERTYATVDSEAMLDYDDIADLDAEEHFRYFATFVGTLLSDYATYLANDTFDLAADRVGYSQAPLWLTDDEFDDLADKIRTLIGEHLEQGPAPGRRRHLLSTIAFPADGGTSVS